jgi:hypothetical protein
MKGALTSTSGTIGGWTLANNLLYSGSGASYVALDSKTSDAYAIWAGNATAANAPFRVKRDGSVYLTSLKTKDASGNEITVNLSNPSGTNNYPLWKLWYGVIDEITSANDTLTIKYYDKNTGLKTVNFSKAGVYSYMSGSIIQNGNYRTASINARNAAGTSLGIGTVDIWLDATNKRIGITLEAGSSYETKYIDITSVYNQGWNACLDAVTSETVTGPQTAYPDGTPNVRTMYYKYNNSYYAAANTYWWTGYQNYTYYTLPARK